MEQCWPEHPYITPDSGQGPRSWSEAQVLIRGPKFWSETQSSGQGPKSLSGSGQRAQEVPFIARSWSGESISWSEDRFLRVSGIRSWYQSQPEPVSEDLDLKLGEGKHLTGVTNDTLPSWQVR